MTADAEWRELARKVVLRGHVTAKEMLELQRLHREARRQERAQRSYGGAEPGPDAAQWDAGS